jgi:hypothetical protein
VAELTNMDVKVAEVIGLAQAAQGATEKVAKLVEDGQLKQTLQRMRQEAVETEERTTRVVEQIEGKKTAILDKARETKQEATKMMQTYLSGDVDALDGFEFLTMAEAGEAEHWEILGTLNERARNAALGEVIEWATPIQQRHFEEARTGALQLAATEDPNQPSS